jgi:hypothetical protein
MSRYIRVIATDEWLKRYDSLISDASLWLLRLHIPRPNVFRHVWVLILLPRRPARDAKTLICLLTPRMVRGMMGWLTHCSPNFL